MFIVAGLGNPGAKYAFNRHNFGFMAIDALAEEYGFGSFSAKFDGLMSLGEIEGQKVLLLKPMTFMNLSGNSLGKAVSFYKEQPQNVIVIHDDMDLDFGRIKAKFSGSAAGHNGLKSIDSHIGNGYARIRLGIGHAGNKMETANFVTGNFPKQELKEIPFILADVIRLFPLLLKGGEAGTAAFSNAMGLEKTKETADKKGKIKIKE